MIGGVLFWTAQRAAILRFIRIHSNCFQFHLESLRVISDLLLIIRSLECSGILLAVGEKSTCLMSLESADFRLRLVIDDGAAAPVVREYDSGVERRQPLFPVFFSGDLLGQHHLLAGQVVQLDVVLVESRSRQLILRLEAVALLTRG